MPELTSAEDHKWGTGRITLKEEWSPGPVPALGDYKQLVLDTLPLKGEPSSAPARAPAKDPTPVLDEAPLKR